jgi:hypothetical protein
MKVRTGLCVTLATAALVLSAAALKNASAAGDATAEITAIENASVKADLGVDKAFYDKTLMKDWMMGDSSGKWYSKADIMKMMDDSKDNKFNSEKLSDIKVSTYGDTAIARYKDTYDAVVEGKHRMRTVITTDTFVKEGGGWKEVASHSSTISGM